MRRNIRSPFLLVVNGKEDLGPQISIAGGVNAQAARGSLIILRLFNWGDHGA